MKRVDHYIVDQPFLLKFDFKIAINDDAGLTALTLEFCFVHLNQRAL